METTAIETKRTEQMFHFQGAVESDEATTQQLLHNSNVESEDEGDKSDSEKEILKEKVATEEEYSHSDLIALQKITHHFSPSKNFQGVSA